MLFIFTFVVSLIVTMVLIPPLMKYADRIGAIDLPDKRKVHLEAIPRVGGIAMIIGSIVSIFFWLEIDAQITGLVIGFIIILFFGVWDDRSNINYRIKFLGQLLAVCCVVFYGDVVVRTVPLLNETLPDYVAIPFTIFALVGITNAINLSDGLDGLAGGTMLLSLCVIAMLSYQAGGTNVALVSLVIAGSIFGFLRHNTYPARLFMGDTGSQFLGFGVGVLVVILTQDTNSAVSPVLPLLILGLPILDTMVVVTQRIYEGRSPFSPDKNHIHHKLLAIGFDHYEAVVIIYIVQSLLVVLAYWLKYESDLLLLFIYTVFSAMVLVTFHLAKNQKWRFHKSDRENESYLRRMVLWLHASGWLTIGPAILLKLGVFIVIVGSVLMPVSVGNDIALLAVILIILMVISMILSEGRVSIIEKAVSYVVCVLAVYLLQNSEIIHQEYNEILNIPFVVLAIAFAIKVKYSEDRSFQVTPLDFLVVFLVIIVPNLPDIGRDDAHMGEMALKLIVMFYASEAVLNIIKTKIALHRIGIISTLVIAAVRGF